MITLNESSFRKLESELADAPYPVYAHSLLQKGIIYYEVEVGNGTRRIFSASGESLQLNGNEMLHCSDTFDIPQIVTALRRVQQHITDYPGFLKEIAAAGVHHYVADLENRTVTYQSSDKQDRYTESIEFLD